MTYTQDTQTIKGHVSLDLIDARSLRNVKSHSQDNLIVNSGKEYFASRIHGDTVPLIGIIELGTGSTPPSTSDTALVTPLPNQAGRRSVLSRNNVLNAANVRNITSFFTTFPENVPPTGTFTIQELALWTLDGQTLISRIVLNTPFEKTPASFLNVTWRIQFV